MDSFILVTCILYWLIYQVKCPPGAGRAVFNVTNKITTVYDHKFYQAANENMRRVKAIQTEVCSLLCGDSKTTAPPLTPPSPG